jgi:hypothetical protein
MSEIDELIKNSGYEYKELAKDVYILYDFITEEERLAYYELATNANNVDWTVFYLLGLEDQGMQKYNRSDIASLVKEGLLNINPSWLDKALGAMPLRPIPDNIANRTQKLVPEDIYTVTGYNTVQRHYPGTQLDEHIDSQHDANLRYATVIYLNDDYQGGELFFRDLGLRIKPPIRSLLIFSADLLHGVDKVLDGPHRYVVTSFIFKKPSDD